MNSRLVVLALSILFSLGCRTASSTGPAAASPLPSPAKLDRVPRGDLNRLAAELALPLFWVADANGNGAVDPGEVATFWGLEPGTSLARYVQAGRFTADFLESYEAIAARHQQTAASPAATDPKEQRRRALVLKELAQGRPTLVATDLASAPREDKQLVEAVLKAASVIERIYAKQMGTLELAGQVPSDDVASRMLFFRNQGFKCQAPRTQSEPGCSAIPNPPAGKVSGLYPRQLLTQEKFCETLSAKDKKLVDPFTVVVEEAGALKAVPYTVAYKAEMTEVSQLLQKAAAALDGQKEAAFKAYLLAASKAFLDNDWGPADEAWAKMNVSNSRWYLRIGPDEVYAEPCSTKALFHVSFGRINQRSVKWQSMLDPVKAEMESSVAALAGAPYKARSVTFHLPDFVDIVLNAGDSRSASGATIGQSLPNFGPVANEGRGRTVAMTNFYTDPDSLEAARATAESLLCSSAMAHYTSDPEPQLMSTVLHEAAHNLGPAHQYKVAGKTDREAFGGPLASTLEELKAQTAALFFTDWLAEKKLISREDADRAHVRDLLWAFGHISRGMYDEDHHPRNYSQLAAIQLGHLMHEKAVTFSPDALAANGKDKGCFSIDVARFPSSVKVLMREVAGIKARGDKNRAEKLIHDHVDVSGDKKALHALITERVLRAPKASFVYSVRFE